MKKKLQSLPCKLSIQSSFTLQEFNSYERRVFLNPKTMTDLDFFVDDFCKFESEKDEEIKFCARVSSSLQVGFNKIGITKDSEIYSLLNQQEEVEYEKEQIFILSKFKSKVSSIDKIELLPNENFKTNSLLNNFITSQLLGTIFYSMNKYYSFSCKIQSKRYFFKIDLKEKNNWFKIQLSTNLIIKKEIIEKEKIHFLDIGGLSKEIEKLKNILKISFEFNERFKKIEIPTPNGILISGLSGTGKTMIKEAIINEMKINHFEVKTGLFSSREYGENEKKLRKIFKDAIENSPSLIIIDNLDILFSSKDDVNSNNEEEKKRMILTLNNLLDYTNNYSNVIIIGITNSSGKLNSSLERPGRFDISIEIPIPDELKRNEILKIILNKFKHELNEKEIKEISSKTHGFVGSDLKFLCNESKLISLRKKKELFNFEDVLEAKVKIKPTAIREVIVEIPNIKWSDIGGQEEIKKLLIESIEWQFKDVFKKMGIKPPKGILLYGPPGCSKTLMAKALATEGGLNFLTVKGPELFSKYVGDSEKAVREIFKKARNAAPSIIFFDEIDSLAVERGTDEGNSVGDRVLSQLLSELDGVDPLLNVMIVAATNRPEMIDKALMRSGRIDRIVYVGLPDFDARIEIFKIRLSKMSHNKNEINLKELAEKSNGYTGAEITSVCTTAGYIAMEEDINIEMIEMKHMLAAMEKVKPRTTQEMLDFYKNFQKK
eukprot:gene943-9850_t